MPGLITTSTEIAEALALSANADTLAVMAFKHQPDAERYLRGRFGDIYQALIDDVDAVGREQAKRAEGILSLAYALPLANFRISELGGLSKIIGMDAGDNREEILSIREIKSYQAILRTTAYELLTAIPVVQDDEDVFSDGSITMISIKGEDPWL